MEYNQKRIINIDAMKDRKIINIEQGFWHDGLMDNKVIFITFENGEKTMFYVDVEYPNTPYVNFRNYDKEGNLTGQGN